MLQTLNKQSVIDVLKAHFEAEPSSDTQKRALLMYRFLPVRESAPDDVIAPGSLIQVEVMGRQSWIFLVPQHGGLVTHVHGMPLQVMTPQSPLGELLLGKKAGQELNLKTHSGAERVYRILSVQ